ncbi:MAG: ATP-dependent helicase [Magnetococcus sp. WYHC-3]
MEVRSSLIDPGKWKPIGVDRLEPTAEEVVRGEGTFSVIAGPGAGKTELLAQKAAFLLQTGRCPAPQRILAISFKKDAAKNLGERIKMRCSPEQAARFDSLTFDAFAKGLLDRFRLALPEGLRPTANYVILKEDPVTQGLGKKELFQNPSELSFPMIQRQVNVLLKGNHLLVKALRLTYSHVFLDEFQDATSPQWQPVQTAFSGSTAQFTAVGDHKQKIMAWAGAVPDIFRKFEEAFSATRKELRFNYRSVAGLVRIQHDLAVAIDQNSISVVPQRGEGPDPKICSVWEFDSKDSEATHLVNYIREALGNGVSPRRLVLLVRQRAEKLENQLSPYFVKAEIGIRNEARQLDGVAIQDLVTEPLAELVLNFLKFGSKRRCRSLWTQSLEHLLELRGIDPGNEHAMRKAESELGEFHARLHSQMEVISKSEEDVGKLVSSILDFCSEAALKTLAPQYRQGDWYDKVKKSCILLLWESIQGSVTWDTVFDRFEGVHNIPLMTIHKSKGLEFHTVLFVGLDNESFWGMKEKQEEGLLEFFVAFSRAEDRAFFTYCKDRGQRDLVKIIYDTLKKAGVHSYSPCTTY